VAQGNEFQVSDGGTEFFSPAAAMDGRGNFILAFASRILVFARRYAADGTLQNQHVANVSLTADHSRPAIAADADGDFVVVWQNYDDFGSYGVYARRFTAAGRSIGGEVVVNAATPGQQTDPSVSVDADGDFVVTWQSSSGQAESDLYARRFDAAGVARGSEFRVFPISGGFRGQRLPAAAMDADGDFVVAWEARQEAGGQLDVFARRFTGIGFQVTGADFVHQSPPHRLRVTFSRDVSAASLQPGDLTVLTVGPQDPPEFTASAVSYDAATRTATFTLPAGQQFLANGNYRATLAAGAVSDSSGSPLSAASVTDFFVLTGDINRDRSVNGTDFAILAGNFGRTGMTFAQGDLTGDGRVDGADFAILAGNFGRQVPPPPPPPAVAVALRAPQSQPPQRRAAPARVLAPMARRKSLTAEPPA
jgi:hypothetical protein